MSKSSKSYKYPRWAKVSLPAAFLYGCMAGILGVAFMTTGEKIEQGLITGRPDSYVPAHTLEGVLGLEKLPNSQRWGLNHVMHWGQGAVAGGIRGVMAFYGIRGVTGNILFTLIRLSIDQTLENVTGVGSPPWTWPRNELIIDVTHKMIYAFTTGFFCDSWI